MAMRCAEVREALPAYVRDGEPSLAVRRHMSRCSECKAELGRYVGLISGLGDLESYSSDPPAELVQTLRAIPARDRRVDVVREHVFRNRGAYLGGVAIAMAGATGALIWRSRRRLATA